MNCFLTILAILLFAGTGLQAQTAEKSIGKGNDYYKKSEYELAEKMYRQALKTDPDNTTAQYNLANALYRQKKYSEAEEILNKISSAKNKNKKVMRSSAYYNSGVLYSRQKDLETSIDAYKNALRLNPDDGQARENLQKALLELKQKQQQQQKDQQETKNKKSRMNQKEAEQKLQELQEKEKQLQQRIQNQKGGNPMPKDW